MNQNFTKIHFIGAGGVGLSALARLCLGMGLNVSGSDRRRNAAIAELEEMGMRFQEGHTPDLVKYADLVVFSSAIPVENEELTWAKENGLPIWKRHQFLPWLARDKKIVAVAGTHGKTTTTGMLAHILTTCSIEPTYVVGGVLANSGVNAQLGNGQYFILEADEYDRTFLCLQPWLALITSMEMDHPDCFRDLADVQAAFTQFAMQSQSVLACCDAPNVLDSLKTLPNTRVTYYGAENNAEWRLISWSGDADGSHFQFAAPTGVIYSGFIPLWGEHTVFNALGAVAAANRAGVEIPNALAALSEFAGVGRRFTVRGPIAGVQIVDDYAHHPTQIAATVNAARQRFPGARIVVLFQPHTFTRTAMLSGEYAMALRSADKAFILPVYGARETGDRQSVSAQLAKAAGAEMLDDDAAAKALSTFLKPGDVLLNLNAGDAEKISSTVLALLSEQIGNN